MRRSLLTVVAAFSLASFGCEDGPNQTYKAPPGNAGSIYNGSSGSTVDPATKDFGYLHGGTNVNELCDGPTRQAKHMWMDSQPIQPPGSIGGINMAGSDCNQTGCSWQGLTIEAAEKTLCQSDNNGDLFGDGALTNCWGDSAEMCAHYVVSTHKINFLSVGLFGPGYNGTLDMDGTLPGCKGSMSEGHKYSIGVYTQIQRDGGAWTVDWHAPTGPNDWRNEITSAITCNFTGLPIDDDCTTSGRCIQGNFGDVAYLYVPVTGAAIWTVNQNAQQPNPSVMARIDVYLSKITPYALNAPNLKIDAEGPTASSGVPLGAQTQPCVLKFGLDYQDFINSCVQVTGNTTRDKSELNKLIGGITHNDERFHFDVQGIDINFSDNRLKADQIVNDTDLPQAGDTSGNFSLDQSTIGAIMQDFTNNDVTKPKDAHGAGLVYLQWARRAQRQLTKFMQAKVPATPARYIGDPACFGASAFANGGPGAGKGCTGLENIITTTPAALAVDPSADGVTLASGALLPGTNIMDKDAPPVLKGMRLGLKPGHQKVAFCDDHTNLAQCSLKYQGDTFSTAYQRVLDVLGGGKVTAMPAEAQDIRFFFKEWVPALVQYLKAEGAFTTAKKNPALVTVGDVDAQTIDEYNLFNDSIGAGQFETSEYIERAFTTADTPPLDIIFEADVKNGIMDAFVFSRYLFRGERALYMAMIDGRDGQDHALGSQDTALLANIFGSPVLRSGWADHTKDSGDTYTAYYCATHNDPKPCKNQTAPLDANGNILLDQAGNPRLAPYEGAFAGNATAFTLGGGASPSVPVPIHLVKGKGPNGDGTYPQLQHAMISVPLHQNPYNLTSGPPVNGQNEVQFFEDWAPKQPGIGFPVALTGTRDRFIETHQFDLSGTQITANIDYDFALDAKGNPTTQIMFLAVETTDFLGDLFICQDKSTKDLLTARMYSSVSTILDWFAAHPTAYNDCQIIIRYSPYGNYADFITSLSGGVRLGVTQGGGFGRIVDGTLFDPSLPGH